MVDFFSMQRYNKEAKFKVIGEVFHMNIPNQKIEEFINKHADEIEVGDYTHFINDDNLICHEDYTNSEVICVVMKMLHDVGEEPLSKYDSDLFGMAVYRAKDVYRLPLGQVMSRIVKDWKRDTWNQPPIKEIVEVMKLLGIQVYLFKNRTLEGNKKDYLFINPKNKLEQVLPYLNKDHYTANNLEDFQQI
mgnify:FL=1